MPAKQPPPATFRLEYSDESLSPCMSWHDLLAHAEDATKRGCRRAMFWIPSEIQDENRGYWQELTLVIPGLVFEQQLIDELLDERDPEEPWAPTGTILALIERLDPEDARA